MTEVCVLASGSKGNALYISDGSTSLLIDAGLSAVAIERRLRSRGLDPASIDAVVVSHEHGDHIQGVGPLSRRYDLPVYINDPTLAQARSQLGTLHKTATFRPGVGFSIGDLDLHPFSISHDASDAVGFAVRAGSTKIGVATDLGVATQLVIHHLKGCEVMVLEANHDVKMLEQGPYPWHVKQRIQSRLGHLSNESCRDLLAQLCHRELRHVILAHLSETNNHPEKALSVVGSVLSAPSTCLSVARQDEAGEVIKIQR